MAGNPIVGDLTHNEIDLMMRPNRTDLLDVLARITRLDALLKAANAAGVLTDPTVGYDPGSVHLSNVLNASDQYNQLAQVFAGTLAVSPAKSFDTYGASIPPFMPQRREVL